MYAGAPGGTDVALDAVLSFFWAVHHLKDWHANDPVSAVTKAEVDSLINRSLMLRLCADLANGSKHLSLTPPRTGDKSTDIARNDVAVFAGTGTAAHRFYVQSGDQECEVLDIAGAAVVEWTGFLTEQGPLVIQRAKASITAWTEFLADQGVSTGGHAEPTVP